MSTRARTPGRTSGAGPATVAALSSELLGRPVALAESIGAGRNSRVYRLQCRDSTRYVAKLYYDGGGAERDRLRAEFGGLGFLWENGERAVPRPVAASADSALAIYDYVDGAPVPSSDVTESDIDQAVALLHRLSSLTGRDGSDAIGPAAAACFSVRAILDSIRSRLGRLSELQDGEHHEALHSFLTGGFIPAVREIEARCEAALDEQGLTLDAELDRRERTLSPSDFGFHNAVRRPDGEIVFLDFEYFGWDDPAKMVSDFLLHPAMDVSDTLKRRFYAGVVAGLEGTGRLEKRVEVVYPLFGLKWCMILLNEFVPERSDRRDFARGTPEDRGETRLQQLAMAKEMLRRTKSGYQGFPYAA